MGLLTTFDESRCIYLKSSPTLGRDSGLVDTLLHDPLCSRLQCIVSYHKEGWVIEDKSKNGTWLNGDRLKPGRNKLRVGDQINFPGDTKEVWRFADNAAPRPVLVDRATDRYLELNDHCNILPNEEDPELLITKQGDDWIVEEGERVYNISGGSALMFSNQLWHFYPNDLIFNTVTQIVKRVDHSIPQLSFKVSLNEENVQMSVAAESVKKEFGYKAHHVLLRELARRCIEDEKSGIATSEHGWISSDLLIKVMGIEPTHLNLLIYRSRKAFESCGLDYTPIDRRQGEIRLNPCKLSVIKGDVALSYAC